MGGQLSREAIWCGASWDRQGAAGRYSFETFEEYVEARWDWSDERARQIVLAATAAEKVQQLLGNSPSRESHVRPLLKLENDSERAAAWQAVVDNCRQLSHQLVRYPAGSRPRPSAVDFSAGGPLQRQRPCGYTRFMCPRKRS